MHSLLRLVATQPDRLAEHAQAYAELLALEVGTASTALKRRVLLAGLASAGAVVGLVLAGVALMLWGVTPADQIHAPWVLVAAPLLPLAFALGCTLTARAGKGEAVFAQVRHQLKADMHMLREAAAP